MKMNNVKNIASDLAFDTIDRVAEGIHHGQDAVGATTKGRERRRAGGRGSMRPLRR